MWTFCARQTGVTHTEIGNLSNALIIAFGIGCSVSLLVSTVMLVVLMLDFRVQALEARRGRWKFDRSKIKLADVTTFIGLHIRLVQGAFLLHLFDSASCLFAGTDMT